MPVDPTQDLIEYIKENTELTTAIVSAFNNYFNYSRILLNGKPDIRQFISILATQYDEYLTVNNEYRSNPSGSLRRIYSVFYIYSKNPIVQRRTMPSSYVDIVLHVRRKPGILTDVDEYFRKNRSSSYTTSVFKDKLVKLIERKYKAYLVQNKEYLASSYYAMDKIVVYFVNKYSHYISTPYTSKQTYIG